jgi:plastocyanin
MYGLVTSLIVTIMLGISVSAVTDTNQTVQVDNNLTNYSVNISNFAFEPKELNITVNSSVTWTNNDTARHNIVTDAGATSEIKSPLLNKGEMFTYNFTEAGDYPYHCGTHPSMVGIIHVNP